MVIQNFNKGFQDMCEKQSELNIVKKAGGSIVNRPALFSHCGRNLFVVWGNNIRSYNVETGELVALYSGLSKDAIGIAWHPYYRGKLIAVSSIGELIEWDYTSRASGAKKIQLGEGDGQILVQSFCLVSERDDESVGVVCVVAVPGQVHARVRTFCSTSGKERNMFPIINVDNHHSSLAARECDGEILLAGFINKPKTNVTFCIKSSGSELRITEFLSQNHMTCIACHPTELCVITGDIIGCVRVWRNLLRKPVWTAYHWHTLPVETLFFSDSGTHFFSGGGECVLVRWLLESAKHKNFLPRLSAEIIHLSGSPGNTLIAISTKDNGIHVVNSSFQFVRTIQHFSWSVLTSTAKYMLPHEMTYDPRTKHLVMNGRVGHLQFFSVDQGNMIFLLDVVGRNYLTQERFKEIKNTEVVKFAFNTDGSWLATVEYCEDDKKTPIELRLKFWEFNKVKQEYVLNTCIENPHRGKVNGIQFRPSMINENLMCITTAEDLKFRTWTLDESTSIYRKGYIWGCENVGFYRQLPIRALSFAMDGSLMAVAFGPTLTVWVPGSNQLKCSLTRSDTVEHLSHVQFGQEKCVHLVITGSKRGIAVWNLLSLSLLWVVHFNLSILISDSVSERMAAFSDKNDVVIFCPNSPDPVFRQDCLIPLEDSKVVNAAFIPHSRQKNSNVKWQSESQLYILNSKQELFCLEHDTSRSEVEEGRNLDVLPAESFKPKTAYGALVAQESRSEVISAKRERHKHLGIPGFKTLRELIDAPAHAMPPLSFVGYSLLASFISKSEKRSGDSQFQLQLSEDDEKMDMSDDSDVETSKEERQTSNFEQKKQDIMRNLQSTNESTRLVDIEQGLLKTQKQSMDWVSEFLT